MLQQTRVETVLAYYGPFLARFPDLASLAAAPEEEVLARWSGLGYYRRARSLRAAARVLVERHGGRFPSDPVALRALPGIGPYTAGALLSIAFDRPAPLVDGNVARVLARWSALDRDPALPAARRWLWRAASELLPARGAGEWNQALMELGATICIPRAPRCEGCPVPRHCRARGLGLEGELPRTRPRPAGVEVELLVLLVPRAGRWLVERRDEQAGRMAGLLEFPTVELPGPGGARSGLFPAALPRSGAGTGAAPLLEAGRELGALRHAITRHRIHARVVLGRARFEGRRAPYRWLREAELGRLALTGMARKVLAAGLLDSGRAALRRED